MKFFNIFFNNFALSKYTKYYILIPLFILFEFNNFNKM